MKALSISQPWSSLILSGEKSIETRSWSTNFRGKFFIHAPKRIDLPACARFNIEPKSLITGALVGTANLVNVKHYTDFDTWVADVERHLNPLGNYHFYPKKPYGFVLGNIERLEKPVPYKGALNFFEVAEKEAQQ